jgi:hypothetical protein
MEWSTMPDGSVDWMTVFQLPKVGFLPFMERAGTCEKPCECFLLIIDLLFTRIGDVDILATYHKTAEEFFWVRRMKGRCLDKSSSCAW